MVNPMERIVIIGAGNIGTHLAHALVQHVSIVGIMSQHHESAHKLAGLLNCPTVERIEDIPSCDLILVCVPDKAIGNLLQNIPAEFNVAYTSGAVSISDLPIRENLGVLYPLQTFSREREVNLFEVPFLIEASNTFFSQYLFDLARKLSHKVIFAGSEDRKKVHVSAVFVNNFVNHLALLAKNFMDENQLDWELLKPLLKETSEKLLILDPCEAQTGPARRKDTITIEAHLKLLEGLPKEVYTLISKSIEQTYQAKKND
jgi:predicted short-subunit dehydrogenase-like oxidoreductase (DUF2520 family)